MKIDIMKQGWYLMIKKGCKLILHIYFNIEDASSIQT